MRPPPQTQSFQVEEKDVTSELRHYGTEGNA